VLRTRNKEARRAKIHALKKDFEMVKAQAL